MRRGLQVLAVGLAIVGIAGSASNKYVVRPGDSISKIAATFKVSPESIIKANKLSNPHKLQVGMTLTIPIGNSSSSSSRPATKAGSPSKSASSAPLNAPRPAEYVIKRGDNDWLVARRLGVSVSTIHELNPGVNWSRLQIGQTIRVPAVRSASSTASPSKPAATRGGKYTVVKGDNDWVIASRLGTTATKLREANPGVVWTRLQIGQKLNVPGGAKIAGSANSLGRNVVVSVASVNVRKGPGTEHGVVAKVARGSLASVLDQRSSWYKVRLAASGKVGWIRDDMLKEAATTRVARSSAAPPAAKVVYNAKTGHAAVDLALSMLGTRYRYGMSSRSGTDCSGLTTLVYRELGVKLPRTSAEQSRVGSPIAKSDLKPGDLVFFRTGRSRRINHVGLYMGDGKFVHSSSSKRQVRVDSLSDGYYQTRYVTARRVKGDVVAKGHKGAAEDASAQDPAESEAAASDAQGGERSAIKPDGAGPKAHVPGRAID